VLLPAVCQQARQQPLSYSKRNILNLTFQPCPCGGLPEVAVPYPDMWQDCRITFPHTSHATPSRAIGRSTPSLPRPTWKRPPGRPRTKWTDQLRRDNNNVPAATLWRQAIGRGHSRTTLRSELTTRYVPITIAIRARYNILRGVMCFRAILNMSILLRCCRML